VVGHAYVGWVRHRRHAPVRHGFRYRHAMVGVDLAVGHAVEQHPWFAWRRPGLIRLHRGDFLGDPHSGLADAVRDEVQRATGLRPLGAIELITLPRALGCSFNPVSFYLCQHQGRLAAIVAEITNTPWLERHRYVLEITDPDARLHRFRFAKRFHISPFNGMRQEHDWTFAIRPGRFAVHMVNREDGQAVFDATMALAARPLSLGSLWAVLRGCPLLGVQALLLIYLHAARLWRKQAVFHPHPSTLRAA
jgi:DUF1365 family protein